MNTARQYAPADVQRAKMADILENGIKPHANALARIALDGDIAIVFYKPNMDDPEMRDAVARWRGSERSNVIRLTRSRAARLFGNADAVTKRWMTTRAVGGAAKIFLVTDLGTLLINYVPSQGYSFEPGSLDSEYLS